MKTTFLRGFHIKDVETLKKPSEVMELHTKDEQKTFKATKTTKTFESTVTIEFSKPSGETLRERIAHLLDEILKNDSTIRFLPADMNSDANPITSGKNVPNNDPEFAKFFTDASKNNQSIKVLARVQSEKPMSAIKRGGNVWGYLTTNRIFIKFQHLKTANLVSLGWVFNIHPEATGNIDLRNRMAKLVGLHDFQLNPRNVTYKGGEIKTRAWVIEVAKENAHKYLTKFMETFHVGAEFTIIPFADPTQWDKSGKVKNFYYQQNAMLREAAIVRVDGLHGIDEPMFEKDGDMYSVRDMMEGFVNDNGEHIILSVSQYNSNRVTFLTTKPLVEQAKGLIDELINQIPTLTEDEQAFLINNGKPPVRVGKRDFPASINVYIQKMSGAKFTIANATDEELSQFSAPPTTNKNRTTTASYADVLRGEETIQVTQPSTTSPLTHNVTIDTEAMAKIQELMQQVKQTTEQLRALEQKHERVQQTTEERLKKLEDFAAENVKLMQEVNTNTKAMADSNRDLLARFENLTNRLDNIIPNVPVNSPPT